MSNDDQIFEYNDIVWVEGFPFAKFGPTEEIARSIIAMVPKPGDIILSTYPKCGTTWTQFIIWGILHDGAEPPNTSVMMFKEFPFLELTGLRAIENMPSPRTMKFHLPYRLIPKSPEARYVCVMRNVFDCCVSFYYHILELEAKPLGKSIYPFDVYFDNFIKGTLPFGDYFEQVESWYERKDDPNVLFLTYEDMKDSPKDAVLKIAHFLGLKEKLETNPEMLANILKHSSFEYMREHAPFRILKEIKPMDELTEDAYNEICNVMRDEETLKDDKVFVSANFFRKGEVGDGKMKLNDEQCAILNKIMDDKVKDPELRKLMRRTKV